MKPARREPRRFHHDFETFSKADITKVGASQYARDPSTEVLMLAYAFNDEPVKQWVPVEGEPMPAEVEDAILDPDVWKFAWNKPFEWNIWAHVLGYEIPHDQWRDPMVLAYSVSLPGKLEKAGPIVGLPPEMLKKDGKRLIKKFSVMKPPTKRLPRRRVHWYDDPDDWQQYLDYNRWDVIAEREIYLRLRKYNLPPHEWELWYLDQEINERGIPVNLELARNAIAIRDELVAAGLDEMARVTGLENPNSSAQLLPWLQDQGYPFTDLKAGHIKRALEVAEEEGAAKHYRRILELRTEVSRTSTKKFDSLVSHVGEDGRLRHSLQFAGAGRTWRWSGRVYQPQNLARPTKELEGLAWEKTPAGHPRVVGGAQVLLAHRVASTKADVLEQLYDRPMDVLSAAVRPAVQAPPGWIFIDADLNAIENRVLGWLANDRRILSVFEQDKDPYIDFATYLFEEMYELLYDAYKSGDKSKRTVAKPGVLGCGYMLGAGKQYEDKRTGEIEATGLLGYAWGMGVKLTPEMAKTSVDVWRATYKRAVKFWYDLERAAVSCMDTAEETRCRHIRFDRRGQCLRMILPSGRALHYWKPRMMEVDTPWGAKKRALTYEQLEKSQWRRISTHPGKLTENADQATARDLIAHGLVLAKKEGIDTVMHVHDQIVGLVREEEADEKLTILLQCMAEQPKWAAGLPMKAAGHISEWFVKD